MERCILFLVIGFITFLPDSIRAQDQTKNVFLITLDGLRWEEVFGGAVDSLMNDPDYVQDTLQLKSLFDGPTKEIRRKKLMPWFWSTLVSEGQIYGNRWAGNEVKCSNPYWFSYPGYNEILTGFSDPSIDSNAKNYNKNITVLEWMNNLLEYNGKIAAFASWDVFPYIINDRRSGIPVNAGFRKAKDKFLTYKELLLNQLQDEIPSPWSSVRLDAFTHHFMIEHVKKHHPRVVYIAYGETDDFAHDGAYDQYLKSANQTDKWIGQLWDLLQSDDFYKNQTTLLITTDHGRGHSPKSAWKGHGDTYEESSFIWMAVIGPDTPLLGEVTTDMKILQNQFAKTAAAFLKLDYKNPDNQVGPIIRSMLRQ